MSLGDDALVQDELRVLALDLLDHHPLGEPAHDVCLGAHSLRGHDDVGDLEFGPSSEEMARVAAVLEDVVHRSSDEGLVVASEVRHHLASFRPWRATTRTSLQRAAASCTRGESRATTPPTHNRGSSAEADAGEPAKALEASEVVAYLRDLPRMWDDAPGSRRALAEALFERVEVLGLRRMRIEP